MAIFLCSPAFLAQSLLPKPTPLSCTSSQSPSPPSPRNQQQSVRQSQPQPSSPSFSSSSSSSPPLSSSSLPLSSSSSSLKTQQKKLTSDTTDWVASSLTRRFGLGAGLAWVAFLTVGVVSEQIKTRFEASQQQANTKVEVKCMETPQLYRYLEFGNKFLVEGPLSHMSSAFSTVSASMHPDTIAVHKITSFRLGASPPAIKEFLPRVKSPAQMNSETMASQETEELLRGISSNSLWALSRAPILERPESMVL